MKTKIYFKWAKKEDKGKPNNGYSEETEYIKVGEHFDFGDYLENNGLTGKYEKDGDTYYIINDEDERTGEAYQIIKTEIIE